MATADLLDDLLDVDKARGAVDDATRSARRQFDSARHTVGERATAAGGDLRRRAGMTAEAARSRYAEMDLEPRVRRAKIGFWTVVRSVLGVLISVPAAVVRALGALSDATDDAVERGTRLRARSRKVARSLPVTRAARRRARARNAAWAVGGFALGALAGSVGGYLAGRRSPEAMDRAWDTARASTQRARATASEVVERARDAAAEVATSAQEKLEQVTDDAAATVAGAADRLGSGDGEAAERGTTT